MEITKNHNTLTFEELLDSIGQKAKEYLEYIMKEKNIMPFDDMSKYNILYSSYFDKSVLSLERQIEILKQLPPHMKKYKEKKKELLKKLKKSNNTNLEKPAWWTISTTDSKTGYRLSIGLKNSGCEYWKNSKDFVGCTNCGYFTGTLGGQNPTQKQIVNQFERALLNAKNYKYDVIEFLSDGSFLNNNEVFPDARKKLIERAAKEKNIKKITIESRPEYISIEKIEQLIDILREDQKLNIAFGLETRDVFIQNFCINKGYGTKEFEKIVEMIFNINKKCANKICVFVYGLIKPAYLEEKEAIQDMVRAGVYINKLSKKYPFDIYMKLEPCVVPDGTLLEILFDEKTSSGERKYTPPSYWSVVEIIARLEKANAVTKLRIGSREDMDAFKAIPAVYYDIGMMSNYDFIIYEAVQRYNYHRNIVQLLLDIEIAFNDKTLQEWKNKVKIQHPCFLSLHKKYKSKMNILKKTAEYSQRMKFLDNLFEALDIIEYSEQIQRKAKNIWAKNIEESKKDIKKTIEKIISSYLPNTKTNIEHIELLNYDLKLLRMQIQIQHENKNYGVWVGIPTARRVNIQEVK